MRSHGFLAALLLVFAIAPQAHADHLEIRSPVVEFGELEFEHFGQTTFDKPKSGRSNNQAYSNEIEYGVLPWLKLGIESNLQAPTSRNLQYDATAVEGTIQLTPQGKYFADFGFFIEIERPRQRGDEPAAEFTFGPLVESELGRIGQFGLLHRANLLIEKTAGRNAGGETPIKPAWQSRLLVNPMFQPGVEYFGEVNSGEPARHRVGPVIASDFALAPFGLRGTIKTEASYLVGLNAATERGTVRWHLEYGIAF